MQPDPSQNQTNVVVLSVAGFAAMALAYALIWAVLSDPDMAAKLTNGEAPPGTAVVENRVAVVAAIVAALSSWIATIASKRLIPVLLVLVATVPFAPVALFTFLVAF